MDFKSALGRVQNDKRVGKRVTIFAKIVGFLRGLPSLCSQEEALKFTLELITSQRSRNTLQHVIELSLQKYKIKESNLLHYFQEGLIHGSLRTLQGKRQIEKWASVCAIFALVSFPQEGGGVSRVNIGRLITTSVTSRHTSMFFQNGGQFSCSLFLQKMTIFRRSGKLFCRARMTKHLKNRKE